MRLFGSRKARTLDKLRSTIQGILTEDEVPVDKAALHDEAIAKTQELADLVLKKHALLLDLRKALIMQKWQPDAFAHGSCKLSFVGATTAPLKTWRAELHLGNGETRSFPLNEVPTELLDDDIRKGLAQKGGSYFQRLPRR